MKTVLLLFSLLVTTPDVASAAGLPCIERCFISCTSANPCNQCDCSTGTLVCNPPAAGTLVCNGMCCPGTANGSASCLLNTSCSLTCNSGYHLCGGACWPNGTCCDTHDCQFTLVLNGSAVCEPTIHECVASCNPGYHTCDLFSSCYADTDVTHCGATNSCGACTSSPGGGHATCESDACTFECDGGLSKCGGSCVDEQHDTSNCGSCATVCPSGANGAPVCNSGVCGLTCQPSFPNICSGACVNEQADVANCGSCGHACPVSPDHGQTVCSAGVCDYTCTQTFPDKCSGACVNKLLDTANCGGCGTVCATPAHAASTSCAAGQCGFACDSGYKKCGSACIPVAACCTAGDCAPTNPCDALPGATCDVNHQCHFQPLADNTPCNQDLCNPQVCFSDICTARPPVVCAETDCTAVGDCDPKTGICSHPNKPDDTACGDNPCYAMPSTCKSGQCQAPVAKDCSTADPCLSGYCDPADGTCKTESANSGVACVSDNKCLLGTTCQAGTCAGTPKACAPQAPCHTAACDPGSGQCGDNGVQPAATVCTTGSACVMNEACDDQGNCLGQPAPDGAPCATTTCEAGSCNAGSCMCASMETPDMALRSDGGTVAMPTPDAGPLLGPGHGKHGGCIVAGVDAPTPPSGLGALALLCVAALWYRRRGAGEHRT